MGFAASGEAYDGFMGRYSTPLGKLFVAAAGVREGDLVLDLGCGPGAITGELVRRVGGAASVRACDPSTSFVAGCAERHRGVEVREAAAEALPYADGEFDAVLAQLVLNFVSEPLAAMAEVRRVLRGGGILAAAVWDYAVGMRMLRLFWDAARALDAEAPDEGRTMRFGAEGELTDLLARGGFRDVSEGTLRVESPYAGFEEFWAGFLGGVGPAGVYCASLDDEGRRRLRRELYDRLDQPAGAFTLEAVARYARGRCSD